MSPGIVDDDAVGHAMLAQLPGGQRGALVAGPRLVDPDTDDDTLVMGSVDRGQSRAPVHRREPARITMGENIHRRALGFALRRFDDEGQAVDADISANSHVLVADFRRSRICCRFPLLHRQGSDVGMHLIYSPAQVDRRGAGLQQGGAGRVQGLIGGVPAQGQINAIGGGGAYQRRPAHLHGGNGVGGLVQRGQAADDETMGKQSLVDNLHRLAVFRRPDGAHGFAVHLHGARHAFPICPARGPPPRREGAPVPDRVPRVR